MPTETSNHKSRRARRLALGGIVAGLVLVTVGYLLIRDHTPGDMARGFLTGGLIGVALCAIALWRAVRRPGSATVIERAWTQTGDERDDLVLTNALAVLGLVTLPLTGIAGIAISAGLDASMILALLLLGQLAVGVLAFIVVARRN